MLLNIRNAKMTTWPHDVFMAKFLLLLLIILSTSTNIFMAIVSHGSVHPANMAKEGKKGYLPILKSLGKSEGE